MRLGHNRDRPSIAAGVGRPTQWTAYRVGSFPKMFLFAPATYTRADTTVTPPPVVTVLEGLSVDFSAFPIVMRRKPTASASRRTTRS